MSSCWFPVPRACPWSLLHRTGCKHAPLVRWCYHHSMSVILETSKGDIIVDLFCDDCPIAAKNFLKLCKCVAGLAAFTVGYTLASSPHRIKYYNNCLIHNVQRNFIFQTGDPTGNGTGGDSIYGCVRVVRAPVAPTTPLCAGCCLGSRPAFSSMK